MTQPERFPHDDPREWMNRARANLARAKRRSPEDYLEDLCFDAQQAAEKALKAVMIKRDIDFPYVHDLNRLMSILEQDGETMDEGIRLAGLLTKYATVIRYPGGHEPVSEQAYADAVRIAEAVVRWAEGRL